jgi:hypothetical protein
MKTLSCKESEYLSYSKNAVMGPINIKKKRAGVEKNGRIGTSSKEWREW